jgi:hypothetical protein
MEKDRAAERIEEAIVVATGTPREPGRPAWVVLGVKAVGTDGASQLQH